MSILKMLQQDFISEGFGLNDGLFQHYLWLIFDKKRFFGNNNPSGLFPRQCFTLCV